MRVSRRKSSNFEGADYNLDVDTACWRKNRCKDGIRNKVVFDCGYVRIDETYIIFVDHLLGSSDLRMEQDEDDSTYVAFLENLKERGNAYVLGVALEHGVLFPLKYEAKDDSPDELKRGTSRSCSSSLIQESRSLGVNSDREAGMKKFGSLKEDTLIRKRSSSSIDGVLKSGVKHSGSGKENTQMNAPNTVSKRSEEVGYLSGEDLRSNSRADNVKDSYGVFIGGLKVKGESVFYEYGDGKQVNYEEGDQQKSTDVQNEPSKTVFTGQIPSSRPPVPATTPSQTMSILRAPTPTRPHSSRSLTAKDHHKVANRLSETASRTQIPTTPLTQSSTPTPRAPASTSTCPPRTSIGCSSGPDRRSNSRAATTNGSCVVFVCGLAANRESDYEYGDGKQLYYEEGYQQKSTNVQNKPLETAPAMQIPALRLPTRSPTSSQITPTPAPTRALPTKSLTATGHHGVENKPSETASKAQFLISRPPLQSPIQPAPAPTPTPTPRPPTSSPAPITRTSIVTDCFDMFAEFSKTLKNKGSASGRSRLWFLEKLECICRKPYEQKEYEDLLEKVNVRKPIVRHKETRGGDYTTTGEMGKSYLDNHPDLDNEINKVRSDPNKVLNLLRGFFFYLQHVPHGVPVPWKHPSCMEIMLGSA